MEFLPNGTVAFLCVSDGKIVKKIKAVVKELLYVPPLPGKPCHYILIDHDSDVFGPRLDVFHTA
ncbi:hypothetical protein J6590_097429 [Homalodisca vitripennis]|nr:hypothetical protein J6590_097429 [Homalodisca vitripennis]